MKRSRRPHFWRWIGPHAWTPQAIVHVAQAAVLLIGAVMIDGYLTRSMNDADACRGALALGVALLLAAPRQRSSELLGAVAIWLTTAEFLVASRTGMFALWRWSETLASLAIILVLARLSYFRALARANPWRSFGDLDRRRAAPSRRATFVATVDPGKSGKDWGAGKDWGHRGDDVEAPEGHTPPALADIEGRARPLGS